MVAALSLKNKQGAPAKVGAPCLFSPFALVPLLYLVNTNLADTKYYVPLGLHRQVDVRVGEGGGSLCMHVFFSQVVKFICAY